MRFKGRSYKLTTCESKRVYMSVIKLTEKESFNFFGSICVSIILLELLTQANSQTEFV